MKIFAVMLASLFLLFSLSMGESSGIAVNKILQDSWSHYKTQKIEPNTFRPVADIDQEDIANGSSGQALTFSETISYVLYRSVLINDKETFDRTWKWANQNMQRKNIKEVFHWYQQKWVPVPPEKNDSLFAWRYSPNINHSGRGGVIYYYWTPAENGKLWRDGLDAAPDGDQLIAGSLLLAHVRWGSGEGLYNYRAQAKKIIKDVWEKTVRVIHPGQLECNTKTFENWFKYKSDQGTMEISQNNEAIGLKINNTWYAGLGKDLSLCDLSKTGPIKVYAKGSGYFRIILKDAQAREYRTASQPLTSRDNYEGCLFTLDTAKEPRFDLSKVKTVIVEFSNGHYQLAKVILSESKEQTERYHLFSNDKNQAWINISYYMPFLYHSFAKLDPEHPWEQLAKDSYKDIKDSLYCRLSNNKAEAWQGKGILAPNWIAYNELGQIVDLPWAVDGVIDDYMSGWDAFRVWYFLALDKKWNNSPETDYFLAGQTYAFFKEQLERSGYIRGGYTISGEVRNVNWLDQNSPGMNGAYLAFFLASNDQLSAQKILGQIVQAYNAQGFWDNKTEYYKQNWAWFGLAYYQGLGDELHQKLQAELKGSALNGRQACSIKTQL